MEELEESIRKIPEQVRRWIVYATVVPPAFLLVGVSLLVTDVIDFGLVFWIGSGVLGISAFAWWIWILYSIIKLTAYLNNAQHGINTAIKELEEIREIVKQELPHETEH